MANPQEALEIGAGVISHGDDLVDRWEKELAAGIMPDITEGMAPEAREKLLTWSRKTYEKFALGRPSFGDEEVFADKYGVK